MAFAPDDEIVVSDVPTTRTARLYRWVLDHLAKFPGRVAAVTFAAGAAVTAIVVISDGDTSPTTVISLVATLWALFFAVMIYLLTARDTDKVLEQIADLHEQLATALATPDGAEDETGAQGELAAVGSGAESVRSGATDLEPDQSERAAATGQRKPSHRSPARADDRSPAAPWPTPHRGHGQVPREGQPREGSRGQHPGADRSEPGSPALRGPRVLEGAPAVANGVPSDLVAAWVSATGGNREDLTRAWTRDPRADRQWVLETSAGERWVVFARGTRGIGVIPLDRMRRPGGRGPRRGEGR